MPVNRIARHLDPPAPPPKEDYKGRYEFVSEAVLRAVSAVTRLLNDDDPAVVLKAAKMILDLEKTRMRHGREVHGAPDPDHVDRVKMLPPLWDRPKPDMLESDDDSDDSENGDDDFDDEPAVRPIPYVMGNAPAPSLPAKPPNPDDDDPPARTGEEEYHRWVTGYYYRDRTAAANTLEPLPLVHASG